MSDEPAITEDTGLTKTCQDCGYPYAQQAGACHVCPECGSTDGCS